MRLLVVTAALVVGCGGAAPPAPSAPENPAPAPPASAPTPAAPSAPFALKGTLREEEWKPKPEAPMTKPLGAPPQGLAPAPAACGAFANRKPAAKIKCDLGTGWVRGQASPGLVGMLDTALAESDAARRDALLADVERCDASLAVPVRALRAELAPHE
jgi:hypothetical protein